ncbi:MAG: hypothetical protein DRI36_03405, partial [Caldiserica bacterium]
MRYFRKERFEEIFKRAISEILQKELDFFKTGLVTITKVDISKDLKNCKIYFSAYDDSKLDYVKDYFKKNRRYLKGLLARKVY